jgi:GTP cyclohydrolase II
LSEVAAAARALRGGRAVRIGPLVVLSVETGAMRGTEAPGPLLVSGERAAALGLANERDAADPLQPVLLASEEWLDASTGKRLADPSLDFSRGPAGPLRPQPILEAEAALAAVTLARLTGLLPALWLVNGPASESVTPDAILKSARRSQAEIVARAGLPVDGLAAPAQMVVFRAAEDGSEHAALVIGAPGGKPALVRLHSECLTGDVFGSLKCDCGPQLREALRLIEAAGGGILLYLREEGRGIGLANKIRAYALQDRGLDTVEANRRLGFADDARDHGLAASMLRALGIAAVRLLTNNPAKVAGLEAAGIDVVERVRHQMPANPHNADYLATKRRKSGHLG